MNVGNVLNNMCRRKTVVNSALHDTKLKRCLGIFDLVGLGKFAIWLQAYVSCDRYNYAIHRHTMECM